MAQCLGLEDLHVAYACGVGFLTMWQFGVAWLVTWQLYAPRLKVLVDKVYMIFYNPV